MKPRIHFITIGVADIAASRKFYVDGLGWQPTFEVPGDIIMLQTGPGLILGLFGREDLADDIGGVAPGETAGLPFTLSHNVDSEEAVVAALADAEAAGATVLKSPQRAEFGGFHAYFADPDGFRWEICFNPGWRVEPDGTVRMGAVDG
ncbi:MAG TPA: VOC family protein [Amycolatopsis sp.]|nr:VOC family protein [Amycolatopsis sp.]